MQQELEETKSCPLGSKCVTVINGSVVRCAWHIKLFGQDAQGNKHDNWGCAMTWLPILLIENSNQLRGTTSAVESLRNETIARQDAAVKLIEGGLNEKIKHQ